MKRITLEIQYANGKTEIRQFSDGTYVIGRDTGAIPLHDKIVSGRHGELQVDGTTIVYTDQGSTNGTFTADGVKLAGPLTLSPGTELRMGESKIILKAIHQPSAATVMQPAVKMPTKQERAKTMLGQPAPDLNALRNANAAVATPAAASAQNIPAGTQRPSNMKTTLGQPSPSTPPAVVASRVPSSNATTMGQPAASVPPAVNEATAQPAIAASVSVDPAATTEAPPPATETAQSSNAIEKAAETRPAAQAATQTAGGAGTAGEGYSYNMDIGTLIQTPMKDSAWLMKCLVMGLFTIIPIAGQLNLMGWLVACYQNRKQGIEELPPANFSYLGAGIPLLLAYLPAVGAIIVVNIVLGIIVFILPFLFFVPGLVNLAFSLALFVAGPAIMYLTIEKEMTWTSLRINEMLAFMKANTSAYTALVVAFFIAGLVGGAGGIVIIGSLITIPFSFAMQAVILSEIK